MILYPVKPPSGGKSPGAQRSPTHLTISAWEAVFETQRRTAAEWWLIAQPDHAALAGDLASHMAFPGMPTLDGETLRAIALHDEGWVQFDGSDIPPPNEQGRPQSFLEASPRDFVRAWKDSIERAEQIGPTGGLIVSGHFVRLAVSFLDSGRGSPGEEQTVRDFLEGEGEREKQLFRRQSHSREEIAALVDFLQFCDLVSLYLCCGSPQSVEFPQTIEDNTIRMYHEGKTFRSDPQLFGAGVSLGVWARKWPSAQPCAISIPFLLT